MTPLFKVLLVAGGALLGFLISKDEDEKKPVAKPSAKPEEKPAPKADEEKK